MPGFPARPSITSKQAFARPRVRAAVQARWRAFEVRSRSATCGDSTSIQATTPVGLQPQPHEPRARATGPPTLQATGRRGPSSHDRRRHANTPPLPSLGEGGRGVRDRSSGELAPFPLSPFFFPLAGEGAGGRGTAARTLSSFSFPLSSGSVRGEGHPPLPPPPPHHATSPYTSVPRREATCTTKHGPGP